MKVLGAAAAALIGLSFVTASPAAAESLTADELADEIQTFVSDTGGAEGVVPESSGAKAECRTVTAADRAGDVAAVDAASLVMSMDCATQAWGALIDTYDSWVMSEFWDMTIIFDVDNNTLTGCNGFDYGVTHDGASGAALRTPTCATAGWSVTGPVAFASPDDHTAILAWTNASIGNPQGPFRANVSIESIYDDSDSIPDIPSLVQVPGSVVAPAPAPTPLPIPVAPSAPLPVTDQPGSFFNGRCEIPFGQTATNNSVARLYNAYFLRPADGGGLGYWVPRHRSGELCLTDISEYFAQSNEFTSRYGFVDNANFVRLVYVNVLGREPDPAGYNFWAQQITFGGVRRGTMMVGFSESPEFRSRTQLP